jgi:peptidoglycan hydrolase-like protein with peptidoglycan-binding domain
MILDYAWGRPSVASLHAAGVTGVVRYLSHDATGKNLSNAEAHLLMSASPPIDVAVIWESTANRVNSGRTGGVADAVDALAQAHSFGMPTGRPIFFACDYDAGPDACTNYLRGAASVIGLGRVGLYAGYVPIVSAFDKKLITYGWQTYAWSGGRWDVRAQLRQYSNSHLVGGVDVDYNKATRADWGGWLHVSPLPVPPPKPPPTGPPVAPPFSGRVLKYPPFTTGSEVKAWQAKMHQRGWKIVVDGVYGPSSKTICLAFQNDKRLTHRDGIVGLETWRATWVSPVTP